MKSLSNGCDSVRLEQKNEEYSVFKFKKDFNQPQIRKGRKHETDGTIIYISSFDIFDAGSNFSGSSSPKCLPNNVRFRTVRKVNAAVAVEASPTEEMTEYN